MFFVPCGVWQSRQVIAHDPWLLPAVSEEWMGTLWQSLQSWLALSRRSSFPSPLPAAIVTMLIGSDLTVPLAFAAVTCSLRDTPSPPVGLYFSS